MTQPRTKKKQHYVPQFLVKHFANTGGRLVVLDKREALIRENMRTEEVFHENYFYRVPGGDGVLTSEFEDVLSEVEGIASQPIARILQSGFLDIQSKTDRNTIATFVAVQVMRTPLQRRRIESIQKLLKMIYANNGWTNHIADELASYEQNGAAPFSIVFLRTVIREVSEIVESKQWALYSCEANFHLGDSAVVWRNVLPPSAEGNKLGMGSEGIQLLLPLSSKLCLFMACPIINSQLMLRYPQYASKISFGDPILVSSKAVRELNELQLNFAARFVLSPADDFSHDMRVPKENPQLKDGPRFEIISNPPLDKIREELDRELFR